jgi:hypothetical protein
MQDSSEVARRKKMKILWGFSVCNNNKKDQRRRCRLTEIR